MDSEKQFYQQVRQQISTLFRQRDAFAADDALFDRLAVYVHVKDAVYTQALARRSIILHPPSSSRN